MPFDPKIIAFEFNEFIKKDFSTIDLNEIKTFVRALSKRLDSVKEVKNNLLKSIQTHLQAILDEKIDSQKSRQKSVYKILLVAENFELLLQNLNIRRRKNQKDPLPGTYFSYTSNNNNSVSVEKFAYSPIDLKQNQTLLASKILSTPLLIVETLRQKIDQAFGSTTTAIEALTNIAIEVSDNSDELEQSLVSENGSPVELSLDEALRIGEELRLSNAAKAFGAEETLKYAKISLLCEIMSEILTCINTRSGEAKYQSNLTNYKLTDVPVTNGTEQMYAAAAIKLIDQLGKKVVAEYFKEAQKGLSSEDEKNLEYKKNPKDQKMLFSKLVNVISSSEKERGELVSAATEKVAELAKNMGGDAAILFLQASFADAALKNRPDGTQPIKPNTNIAKTHKENYIKLLNHFKSVLDKINRKISVENNIIDYTKNSNSDNDITNAIFKLINDPYLLGIIDPNKPTLLKLYHKANRKLEKYSQINKATPDKHSAFLEVLIPLAELLNIRKIERKDINLVLAEWGLEIGLESPLRKYMDKLIMKIENAVPHVKIALTEVPCYGDGNCLFNAIAVALIAAGMDKNDKHLDNLLKSGQLNKTLEYLVDSHPTLKSQYPYITNKNAKAIFNNFLASVTNWIERQKLLGYALRLRAVDLSLVNKNYCSRLFDCMFLIAFEYYCAKKLKITLKGEFPDDNELFGKSEFQNAFAGFFITLQSDIKDSDQLHTQIKAIEPALKKFWQNFGLKLFTEKVLKNRSCAAGPEQSAEIAKELKWNIPISSTIFTKESYHPLTPSSQPTISLVLIDKPRHYNVKIKSDIAQIILGQMHDQEANIQDQIHASTELLISNQPLTDFMHRAQESNVLVPLDSDPDEDQTEKQQFLDIEDNLDLIKKLAEEAAEITPVSEEEETLLNSRSEQLKTILEEVEATQGIILGRIDELGENRPSDLDEKLQDMKNHKVSIQNMISGSYATTVGDDQPTLAVATKQYGDIPSRNKSLADPLTQLKRQDRTLARTQSEKNLKSLQATNKIKETVRAPDGIDDKEASINFQGSVSDLEEALQQLTLVIEALETVKADYVAKGTAYNQVQAQGNKEKQIFIKNLITTAIRMQGAIRNFRNPVTIHPVKGKLPLDKLLEIIAKIKEVEKIKIIYKNFHNPDDLQEIISIINDISQIIKIPAPNLEAKDPPKAIRDVRNFLEKIPSKFTKEDMRKYFSHAQLLMKQFADNATEIVQLYNDWKKFNANLSNELQNRIDVKVFTPLLHWHEEAEDIIWSLRFLTKNKTRQAEFQKLNSTLQDKIKVVFGERNSKEDTALTRHIQNYFNDFKELQKSSEKLADYRENASFSAEELRTFYLESLSQMNLCSAIIKSFAYKYINSHYVSLNNYTWDKKPRLNPEQREESLKAEETLNKAVNNINAITAENVKIVIPAFYKRLIKHDEMLNALHCKIRAHYFLSELKTPLQVDEPESLNKTKSPTLVLTELKQKIAQINTETNALIIACTSKTSVEFIADSALLTEKFQRIGALFNKLQSQIAVLTELNDKYTLVSDIPKLAKLIPTHIKKFIEAEYNCLNPALDYLNNDLHQKSQLLSQVSEQLKVTMQDTPIFSDPALVKKETKSGNQLILTNRDFYETLNLYHTIPAHSLAEKIRVALQLLVKGAALDRVISLALVHLNNDNSKVLKNFRVHGLEKLTDDLLTPNNLDSNATETDKKIATLFLNYKASHTDDLYQSDINMVATCEEKGIVNAATIASFKYADLQRLFVVDCLKEAKDFLLTEQVLQSFQIPALQQMEPQQVITSIDRPFQEEQEDHEITDAKAVVSKKWDEINSHYQELMGSIEELDNLLSGTPLLISQNKIKISEDLFNEYSNLTNNEDYQRYLHQITDEEFTTSIENKHSNYKAQVDELKKKLDSIKEVTDQKVKEAEARMFRYWSMNPVLPGMFNKLSLAVLNKINAYSSITELNGDNIDSSHIEDFQIGVLKAFTNFITIPSLKISSSSYQNDLILLENNKNITDPELNLRKYELDYKTKVNEYRQKLLNLGINDLPETISTRTDANSVNLLADTNNTPASSLESDLIYKQALTDAEARLVQMRRILKIKNQNAKLLEGNKERWSLGKIIVSSFVYSLPVSLLLAGAGVASTIWWLGPASGFVGFLLFTGASVYQTIGMSLSTYYAQNRGATIPITEYKLWPKEVATWIEKYFYPELEDNANINKQNLCKATLEKLFLKTTQLIKDNKPQDYELLAQFICYCFFKETADATLQHSPIAHITAIYADKLNNNKQEMDTALNELFKALFSRNLYVGDLKITNPRSITEAERDKVAFAILQELLNKDEQFLENAIEASALAVNEDERKLGIPDIQKKLLQIIISKVKELQSPSNIAEKIKLEEQIEACTKILEEINKEQPNKDLNVEQDWRNRRAQCKRQVIEWNKKLQETNKEEKEPFKNTTAEKDQQPTSKECQDQVNAYNEKLREIEDEKPLKNTYEEQKRYRLEKYQAKLERLQEKLNTKKQAIVKAQHELDVFNRLLIKFLKNNPPLFMAHLIEEYYSGFGNFDSNGHRCLDKARSQIKGFFTNLDEPKKIIYCFEYLIFHYNGKNDRHAHEKRNKTIAREVTADFINEMLGYPLTLTSVFSDDEVRQIKLSGLASDNSKIFGDIFNILATEVPTKDVPPNLLRTSQDLCDRLAQKFKVDTICDDSTAQATTYFQTALDENNSGLVAKYLDYFTHNFNHSNDQIKFIKYISQKIIGKNDLQFSQAVITKTQPQTAAKVLELYNKNSTELNSDLAKALKVQSSVGDRSHSHYLTAVKLFNTLEVYQLEHQQAAIISLWQNAGNSDNFLYKIKTLLATARLYQSSSDENSLNAADKFVKNLIHACIKAPAATAPILKNALYYILQASMDVDKQEKNYWRTDVIISEINKGNGPEGYNSNGLKILADAYKNTPHGILLSPTDRFLSDAKEVHQALRKIFKDEADLQACTFNLFNTVTHKHSKKTSPILDENADMIFHRIMAALTANFEDDIKLGDKVINPILIGSNIIASYLELYSIGGNSNFIPAQSKKSLLYPVKHALGFVDEKPVDAIAGWLKKVVRSNSRNTNNIVITVFEKITRGVINRGQSPEAVVQACYSDNLTLLSNKKLIPEFNSILKYLFEDQNPRQEFLPKRFLYQLLTDTNIATAENATRLRSNMLCELEKSARKSKLPALNLDESITSLLNKIDTLVSDSSNTDIPEVRHGSLQITAQMLVDHAKIGKGANKRIIESIFRVHPIKVKDSRKDGEGEKNLLKEKYLLFRTAVKLCGNDLIMKRLLINAYNRIPEAIIINLEDKENTDYIKVGTEVRNLYANCVTDQEFKNKLCSHLEIIDEQNNDDVSAVNQTNEDVELINRKRISPDQSNIQVSRANVREYAKRVLHGLITTGYKTKVANDLVIGSALEVFQDFLQRNNISDLPINDMIFIFDDLRKVLPPEQKQYFYKNTLDEFLIHIQPENSYDSAGLETLLNNLMIMIFDRSHNRSTLFNLSSDAAILNNIDAMARVKQPVKQPLRPIRKLLSTFLALTKPTLGNGLLKLSDAATASRVTQENFINALKGQCNKQLCVKVLLKALLDSSPLGDQPYNASKEHAYYQILTLVVIAYSKRLDENLHNITDVAQKTTAKLKEFGEIHTWIKNTYPDRSKPRSHYDAAIKNLSSANPSYAYLQGLNKIGVEESNDQPTETTSLLSNLRLFT